MSDERVNDPFVAPVPGTEPWQGTPVPQQAPHAPAPGTIPPPPMAQAPVYAAAPYPTAPYATAPYPPGAPGPGYGAVAYPPAPPAGYMYASPYGAQNTSKNWMGITSLILSLLTLVFGFTCIGGIIFGHMGLSAAKRGEANNRGLSLAGVITGWAFLGLGILFIAAVAIAVANDTSSGY